MKGREREDGRLKQIHFKGRSVGLYSRSHLFQCLFPFLLLAWPRPPPPFTALSSIVSSWENDLWLYTTSSPGESLINLLSPGRFDNPAALRFTPSIDAALSLSLFSLSLSLSLPHSLSLTYISLHLHLYAPCSFTRNVLYLKWIGYK